MDPATLAEIRRRRTRRFPMLTTNPTRIALAKRLVYRNEAQRSDLLDESKTKTQLIALLVDVDNAARQLGCVVLLTMVTTGHHDDGPHGHFGGFAADSWLLQSRAGADTRGILPSGGAYVSGNDPRFTKWISTGSASRFARQVGLVGEADTPGNENAEHGKGVPDSGADHVHWGSVTG